MRSLSGVILLTVATALPLQAQLQVTFGTGANTFTMDFVTIGNPGNLADTTGAPNPARSVPYAYRMGTYEVSRDMITKANTVGGLGITLADMSSMGGNGVNRPATGVSWDEAARFVNWLNTSQGYAPAYKYSLQPGEGGYSVYADMLLWASGDAGYNPANPYRNANAMYFLPSENEWYKAAYFDGTTYFNYPTGSDTAPSPVAGGMAAGTAVYDQTWEQGPADISNAGGLSPYGTMGQGGNVWEWIESADDGVNNSGSEDRGLRGGEYGSTAYTLESSMRALNIPSGGVIGFRVAAVPEPMEAGGVIGLAALGFVLWRRRGSR
jgi:formylglycine-generating enzyme required for sulfatase activity